MARTQKARQPRAFVFGVPFVFLYLLLQEAFFLLGGRGGGWHVGEMPARELVSDLTGFGVALIFVS